MANTLHVIGWTGIKRAYLNISFDEAKSRWIKENNEEDWKEVPIESFEFETVFGVYDAWGVE
jgi:hypothetical protein